MNTWITSSGSSIFQVLSGRSNAYLVCCGDRAILIDTGKKFAFPQLLGSLAKILPHKIPEILFLTHTHFDHCQSASELKKSFATKIIFSEQERGCAETGFTPLADGTNAFTRILTSIGNRVGAKRFGYDPFSADVLIKKSGNLDGFPGIRVVICPGHSKGSLSLIVDDEIALVGDTLFGVFKKRIMPPYVDDKKALIGSWGELLKTKCYLFLPGHGGGVSRKLLFENYKRLSEKWG